MGHAGAVCQIDAAIESVADDALSLLENLIVTNNINPSFPGVARADVIGGEAACTWLIGKFLARSGFTLHDVAPDPERINLAAVRPGRGQGRSLLIGHRRTIQAVVGEETMDHELGTAAVVKAGFRADAAIVAEPSSKPDPLTISPISVGNFNLKISVQGFGAHAGNRWRSHSIRW